MIRKLMVAVAALGLAGTGAVAQGVTFSGSGDLGVKYHGDSNFNVNGEEGDIEKKSYFEWISNFDLAMSASGTTDGGLTFGASATIKAGNDTSDNGDDDSRSGKSTVGASNAYIGGESWKISIGDLDPASHKGQSLGDVGFDGLGVDDVAEGAVGSSDADVEVSFSLGTASLVITAGTTPGAKAVDGDKDGEIAETETAAKKQETQWAAGVSFGIGSTNLGIGMDSEKLMQTSIGADLGAFSGSIFYAQQKEKTVDISGENNPSTAANTVNNKKTGMGVEIKVSAGANTTINAVYAQGKNTDIRKANEAGDAINGEDGEVAATAIAKTDKGFGVGVSHNLGGGATLEAGFGKVKKQTMASVGVSMSF